MIVKHFQLRELPKVLEPNALYYIAAGENADVYVTSSRGIPKRVGNTQMILDLIKDIKQGPTGPEGDEFQIIEMTGSGLLTGEFDEGAETVVEYDGYDVTFSITYEETSGVTLEVTDVSELSAIPLANWALYLGFILMALFVAIRFRGRIL